MYSPTGKRRTLTTDKAFNECPSWLTPTKPETPAERNKRKTQEKTNAKQVAEAKEEITGASFLADPAAGSNVETL
jgi:hypothetical protein